MCGGFIGRSNGLGTGRGGGLSQLVFTTLFSTVVTIFTRVTVPVPTIPVALRIFKVYLYNCVLKAELSLLSILMCVLVKLVKLPIFYGFRNKTRRVISFRNKFVVKFLPLTFFYKVTLGRGSGLVGVLFNVFNILVYRTVKIVRFCVISRGSLLTDFLVTSVPFLLGSVLLYVTTFCVTGCVGGRLVGV